MVAAGVIVGAGTNLDRASEVWTRGVAGEGVEVLGVRVRDREAMRDTGPGGEAMRVTGGHEEHGPADTMSQSALTTASGK